MTVHQLPTAVKAAKTSEPERKLCVQCKHCELETDYAPVECWHPENRSLVDDNTACTIDRFRAKVCKGKFWEKRPLEPVSTRPWWKFW